MKIKKIILTLAITTITLIGFGNTKYLGQGIFNVLYSNQQNSTLDIYVPTNLNFYTEIGNTKYESIYPIYDNLFFYWDNGGNLNIYNARTDYWFSDFTTIGGGPLKNYFLCDYITGDLNQFTNCIKYNYNQDDINTYLNNIISSDKIYYGNGGCNENDTTCPLPFLAFNISKVEKSILFGTNLYTWECRNSNEFNLPCFGNESGNDPLELGYTQIYTGEYYTITNFPNFLKGESPIGQANLSNKFCPMVKFQIDMYGSRFNTGLCYSNTQTISGNQVIEETPITMLEAFPTYQDYNNARNLFTDYCHTDYQNTTEECQTALQSIGRKKAQIIWKAIKNNQDNTILKRERIYQYCYLNLTYTGDAQRDTKRCELTDEQKYAPGLDSSGSPNPLEGYEDMLLDSETEIELPPDGTVFDEILPNGIISWSNLFTNFNFFSSLTELIGKVFILFKLRPTVEGILPPVIMSLLLLIILFRIFKK